MKPFQIALIYLLIFIAPPGFVIAGAHDVVTDHKRVSGVCDQCKNRIENAAYYNKGVKVADWNADTQELTIKYDTTKTNIDKILRSIAKAGHDNELYKATDEDYNSIPKCCRYRTVKKH